MGASSILGQNSVNQLNNKLFGDNGPRFINGNKAFRGIVEFIFDMFMHFTLWTLIVLAASIYYLRQYIINPYIEEKKWDSGGATARAEEGMRRARAEQQKQAQIKSAEAAKMRKLKKATELKEKAITVKKASGGRVLRSIHDDKIETRSVSYNPMDPSTGSSGGSSYRPARRNPNRGGGG